jgi:hypothetical protein
MVRKRNRQRIAQAYQWCAKTKTAMTWKSAKKATFGMIRQRALGYQQAGSTHRAIAISLGPGNPGTGIYDRRF